MRSSFFMFVFPVVSFFTLVDFMLGSCPPFLKGYGNCFHREKIWVNKHPTSRTIINTIFSFIGAFIIHDTAPNTSIEKIRIEATEANPSKNPLSCLFVFAISLSLVPKDTAFFVPRQHFSTFFYIICNTFEFCYRGALLYS